MDSGNFLSFGVCFNTFAKPMVNKFVKARPTQSLGDVVETHYQTSPTGNLSVSRLVKGSVKLKEVNRIRCDPTMPA